MHKVPQSSAKPSFCVCQAPQMTNCCCNTLKNKKTLKIIIDAVFTKFGDTCLGEGSVGLLSTKLSTGRFEGGAYKKTGTYDASARAAAARWRVLYWGFG